MEINSPTQDDKLVEGSPPPGKPPAEGMGRTIEELLASHRALRGARARAAKSQVAVAKDR